MAKYLPETFDDKLNLLWFSVRYSLQKYEREYKNKLNAYFSNMQKEALNSIKQDNYDQVIDLNKNAEKFVQIYDDILDKLVNYSIKRVSREIQVSKEELNKYKKQFKSEYSSKYFNEVSMYVVKTTVKKLYQLITKYKQGKITKQELIQEINNYFNNHCKKYRSKLIAITEVYRIHNLTYMTFMSLYGYRYKVYVAKPKTKCPVCSKMHRQTTFFLEDFDISILGEEKQNVVNPYFPPIHPQSHAILLMIKEI